MAWTEGIDWLDGEVITELKLDQLTQNVVYLQDKVIPTGGIILWSGSVASIPSGWFLCDGNNNTPDLRGRFVVGAGGAYNPGVTGGANTHNHDLQNHVHYVNSVGTDHTHWMAHTHTMANHQHYISFNSGDNSDGGRGRASGSSSSADSPHHHNVNGWAGVPNVNTSDSSSINSTGGMSMNASHTHGNTGAPSVNNTSSSNNIPLYYALCYIMKS